MSASVSYEPPSQNGPKSFLGTGWAFPPQFRRDGKVALVSDDNDIRESLLILLSTRPGERVMRPLYGCGLDAFVFENLSESLRTRLKDTIVRAIAKFETRVTVELISVHADASDPALLQIEIAYRVRATNSIGNLVFPFYLAAGGSTV